MLTSSQITLNGHLIPLPFAGEKVRDLAKHGRAKLYWVVYTAVIIQTESAVNYKVDNSNFKGMKNWNHFFPFLQQSISLIPLVTLTNAGHEITGFPDVRDTQKW